MGGMGISGTSMRKTVPYKQSRGFTLIELMLSIAVIAIITGMSAPVYQSFQVRNDLDIAAVTATQYLRRATVLSQAVDGNINWGVKVQSGDITIFKGTSYASRDSTYDEVSEVPTSITPSGVSEVVFTKLTGLPETTGTITFTSNANETRIITLNAKGSVDY